MTSAGGVSNEHIGVTCKDLVSLGVKQFHLEAVFMAAHDLLAGKIVAMDCSVETTHS
jgi:hypothetical protein